MKQNYRTYSITLLLLCIFSLVGNHSIAADASVKNNSVISFENSLPKLAFFHYSTLNRNIAFFETIEDSREEDEKESGKNYDVKYFKKMGQHNGDLSSLPFNKLYETSHVPLASATKRYILIQVFRI